MSHGPLESFLVIPVGPGPFEESVEKAVIDGYQDILAPGSPLETWIAPEFCDPADGYRYQ